MRVLPLPNKTSSGDIQKALARYTMESLQRHRNIYDKESNTPSTLFSKMYQAEDDDTLTPKEMLHNAQAYIVAGSDTTANTMTYLVWAVCKHPDIRKRLVSELKKLPVDFGFDQLKTLPYLNQVIQETLRMYGAAPAQLRREVPAGGVKIGGHWLPGGATAGTQAYTLHRNPAVFTDPLSFNPSRWENPTQAMQSSLMPFGGGSRSKPRNT